MGSNVCIAGKHVFSDEFEKNRIVDFSIRITDTINRIIADDDNFKDDKLPLSDIEINFEYAYKNPYVVFFLSSIGHIYIFKHSFVIVTFYRFGDFVYKHKAGTSKDAGFFEEFRRDIFAILQIFQSDYVLYLCDNGRILSEYYESLLEGKPFDAVEQDLINRFGEPVTDLNKISDKGDPYTFYDRLNEFVADNFNDMRKK